MNNRSYYQKMLEELAKQDHQAKQRLLLHCCCAVCSSWVVKYLSEYFELTLFFNNSNIYPLSEYQHRLSELKRYIQESGLPVEIVTVDYQSAYQKAFIDYRYEKEGEKRCELCIERRMREAYQYAQDHNFAYFTTVMSVSRNKNTAMINRIGEALQTEYQPLFLYSDFKKNDGALKTNEQTALYQLYRQNYCGCVYSLPKPENCTLDYLPDSDIFLFQRNDMFRINTDTRLLGNYLKVKAGEKVLDVGCNNGALLLYTSRYPYRELLGIDILPEAIALAERNLQINRLENYRLICDDIKNFNETVDVIICNPPYFSEAGGRNNQNSYRDTARHFSEGDFNNFVQAFKRVLDPQGRIYLIYRYNLWPQAKTYLEKAGFKIVDEVVGMDENNRCTYILVTITWQETI